MINNYQSIVEHLWQNPSSQEELIAEPKSYLRKQGVEIPENVEVLVHQGTADHLYLILPPDGTEMPQGNDLRSRMVARATRDAAYKALLQKNPQAAAKEMGVELPDSTKIVVLQDSEDEMHFLIPFNSSNMELSEADLEAVAGGILGIGAFGFISL